MLNVVATLQQRCGNVLTTSESDVVTTSETDVGTTLIFDHVTALWQHCHNVAVPAGFVRILLIANLSLNQTLLTFLLCVVRLT